MDLQALQQQLKLAIQNHQILVAKRRSDPQNSLLPKEISDLQTEIKTLSEKQKHLVQQLRKDLVTKQHTVLLGRQCPTTINHTRPSSLLPTAISVNTKIIELAIPKPLPVPPNNIVIVNPPTCIRNVPEVTKAVVVTSSGCKPSDAVVLPTPLSSFPPIRVPHYSLFHTKPIITQANQLSPTHQSVHPLYAKTIELRKSPSKHPDQKKSDFMTALGLITIDTLTEIQHKKSERKRRTTANPQFSCGNWEHPDFLFPSVLKKRNSNNLLPNSTPVPPGFKRPRGRPRLDSTPDRSQSSTPDSGSPEGALTNGTPLNTYTTNGPAERDVERVCVICHESGDMMSCEVCNMFYHKGCVDPSLTHPSSSSWCCPKCQMLKKSPVEWPGSVTIVHSYIAHKAAREEEKKKLLKRSQDLKSERNQLEHKVQQLTEALAYNLQEKNQLQVAGKETNEKIERLKTFVKTVQGR